MMVYNLAQGKFKEIPYSTRKSQEEDGLSTPVVTIPQKCSSQKLQPLPQPIRAERTPHGPNTMPASTNLFVARASWPLSPHTDEVQTPTFVKTEKADEKNLPKQAAIPHALILNKPQSNKPAEEECRWGPHCPICAKSYPKSQDNEFRRLEW